MRIVTLLLLMWATSAPGSDDIPPRMRVDLLTATSPWHDIQQRTRWTFMGDGYWPERGEQPPDGFVVIDESDVIIGRSLLYDMEHGEISNVFARRERLFIVPLK